MKKILLITMVVALSIAVFFCANSFAQQQQDLEETEEPLVEDDQLFGFGQVVEISKQAMTLLEYDFETDQELQIVYVLNEQTALDNIASLDEIKVDDEIGVNYEEKDGKKIAKTIFKYIEMEEEPIDIEMEGDELPVEASEN
ncbi:MAG TPA: hypothetical protein PLH56_03030 [Candidatus Omnitrophota bacterium]|nr:hypothetical protein [Candidatus Omnitrophota bacterium]HPN88292.1 hypothetical protein [Candidatus Omnitrophota bacterium]